MEHSGLPQHVPPGGAASPEVGRHSLARAPGRPACQHELDLVTFLKAMNKQWTSHRQSKAKAGRHTPSKATGRHIPSKATGRHSPSLCSPFDSAHIIEDLSAGEVRERVLNTVCFQTWADMRKVVGTKADTTVWETSSDVMGTVRVILDSIGLTVSAKRSSKRETGTDSRTYLHKYWVSTDSVTKMQELLALKDGNAGMAGKMGASSLVPYTYNLMH